MSRPALEIRSGVPVGLEEHGRNGANAGCCVVVAHSTEADPSSEGGFHGAILLTVLFSKNVRGGSH